MIHTPKISLIIPVYNRQDLLQYTLDSIIEQTFTDWECILVDDHSSDASFMVMENYQKKDNRFKVYKRPIELKKGANACRNYGFTKTTGSYVKWFDSDDIMLPKHLEVGYQTLVDNQLDFVITDTLNFDHDKEDFIGKPYEFDKSSLTISDRNLALQRIGWITDDFLGKRQIVEDIKFNENIVDGDEYNFFIKMLQCLPKGIFIDEVLTHRRIHHESVSHINRENDLNYFSIVAVIKYQTAQDLIVYENKELIRWLLSGYMQYAFKLALSKQQVPYCKSGLHLICKYYSLSKGLAFIIALKSGKYFNIGYNIMKYARK